MIINHQYRFCFFAIPRTASKAVSKVLIDELNSEAILKMHSGYNEFFEQASPDERQYFSFTTVRHPMDSVVSAYFKKKSNHNGRFSRGTFKDGRPIGQQAMNEYNFITKNDASFQDYFLHFYHQPYHKPRHELTASKVDYLMRYEQLQDDFDTVMNQLNLPTLKIPVFNKTSGRDVDYLSFYTADIRDRARLVFGPIMKDWGYDFPF